MSKETAYAPSRPLEILLVEDNPGDTFLTREAFRKSGLAGRIVVAENGEQALVMLRQGRFHGRVRPDLILLDLNLPRLDGGAVLARLQRDPELKKVPVVILSGCEPENASGGMPSRRA
ncbi:MAG TPA: response regulator, partial [Rhizomicrobium sp.]|nr:response regulator [Rhizomicrobium sp.]